MKKIAVVVFVYNRPVHTEKLFESILKYKNYKKFKYFIFSDFAKTNSDIKKMKDVRNICRNFKKKTNCTIVNNNKNKGLYKSVIVGVSKVLKNNKYAIILEDDLIVLPKFFDYMIKGIYKYLNNNKVLQVTGYSYPIINKKNQIFFSTLTSCWGWAVDSKKWSNFLTFIKNRKKLDQIYKELRTNQDLKRKFNYNNTFDYFGLLTKQFKHKVSSWGILFYLFSFYNQFYTLYPGQSLILNEGFDGSGSHNSTSNLFNNSKSNLSYKQFKFPKAVSPSNNHKIEIEFFFKKKLSKINKLINLFK
jgi:hypothetical protein